MYINNLLTQSNPLRLPNGKLERNTQNEDYLNLLRTKFGYKLGYSLKVQLLLEETNMTTYFKYLIFGSNFLYILNTHVKFCVNWMLFTIRSIHLFFIHSFKLQKLQI